MNVFDQLIHNKCVVIPVALWFIIQAYKVVYELLTTKKLNVKRIMGAGGMPSSHSAVVCSLCVLIGRSAGFNSPLFALSFMFAFIVMYDAAGVRRASGKQAAIINKILTNPEMPKVEVQEKLTEALGHTPIQVFVGALIGIIIGMIA